MYMCIQLGVVVEITLLHVFLLIDSPADLSSPTGSVSAKKLLHIHISEILTFMNVCHSKVWSSGTISS